MIETGFSGRQAGPLAKNFTSSYLSSNCGSGALERKRSRAGAAGAQETGAAAAGLGCRIALGYGLTFALSTALFLFLGWLADGRLGTMPLFLILGAFVGAGAGFYSLYYHLVVEPKRRGGKGDKGTGEHP